MCGIDAVGYQAHSDRSLENEDPATVVRQLAEIVTRPAMSASSVFTSPKIPGGKDEHARRGEQLFPLGAFWDKGIGIEMGQAPVKRCNAFRRDMIIHDRAKPSFIVSHRLPLSRAAEAYSHFVMRSIGKGESYMKVVLKPAMDRARLGFFLFRNLRARPPCLVQGDGNSLFTALHLLAAAGFQLALFVLLHHLMDLALAFRSGARRTAGTRR
jgi:hypothetical protein